MILIGRQQLCCIGKESGGGGRSSFYLRSLSLMADGGGASGIHFFWMGFEVLL